MKNKLYFIFLIALLTSPSMAQKETTQELFDDANYFFDREEFAEAAYLYKQILLKESDNYNVYFKLGSSLLEIEGRESEAIPYLIKASQHSSDNYHSRNLDVKNAPLHSWFMLGNAYRLNNQLDEALDAYSTFSSLDDFEKNYNANVLAAEIKAVSRAKIIQDAPIDLYRSCYESPINTTGNEYHAVISADEQVMIWMISQKFYEAIVMSRKLNGKWSNPTVINPQVQSDGDMFPTSLSEDGSEMLLVKHGEFDSDIYYSKWDGTFWSKAELLKGEVNSNFTEDYASFVPGEDKIIFSSDRRGSVGGLDLFISELGSNGRWKSPVNLGPSINTNKDESSPYISPNGKALFFSSTGHFNMGGSDIFRSEITSEGKYGPATNMGYPINNTSDNVMYIPLNDGNSGIMTFADTTGHGKKDIWYLEIVPFDKKVERAVSRLSEEDFTISITDNESGEVVKLKYDAVEDRILLHSNQGKQYSVIYTREKNE